MSKSAEFRRELTDLFQRRTHWLRAVIQRPRKGAPPKFQRRHVNEAIGRLQDLASAAFAVGLARREFDRSVRFRRSWRATASKGRQFAAKRKHFARWYEDNFGASPCVYVFWEGKTCEYVGRTGRGGARPSSHFEKLWIQGLTRVDVYTSTARALPALECLAIHRFRPTRNKTRAASRKWTRKCPLCALHRDIDSELRDIFRLR